jgi:hypothetical protein
MSLLDLWINWRIQWLFTNVLHALVLVGLTFMSSRTRQTSNPFRQPTSLESKQDSLPCPTITNAETEINSRSLVYYYRNIRSWRGWIDLLAVVVVVVVVVVMVVLVVLEYGTKDDVGRVSCLLVFPVRVEVVVIVDPVFFPSTWSCLGTSLLY